tara:strand:+ start:474 stop:854 length:381 start_codon:yes stop_codon:yes gene_type:complete
MARRTKRQTKRQNNRRRTRSKSKSSGYKPSVNNSVSKCVQLFRKYRLTTQSKLVKWVQRNHSDQADARGSKQSSKLQDDYKFITGCFAQRKQILKQLKSKSKSKSKSKKKKSKYKAKKLKDDSVEW